MADSAVIQVADAVVASLNAGSFEPPFTAQRRYRPTFDLAELDTLRVSVVPRSVEITNATRSASYFDCTVDIGIQQKVDAEDGGAIDSLMDLVQQIADHLRMQRLSGLSEAVWLRIANEPVFAPEHLDQQRVFTSVISVTYRLRR